MHDFVDKGVLNLSVLYTWSPAKVVCRFTAMALSPLQEILNWRLLLFITSAKEVMFSSLFICLSVSLSVSNFARKLPNGFA